jgi:transposase
LAKTDAVDARMLADMGAKFALKADDPIDPQRARLADLEHFSFNMKHIR